MLPTARGATEAPTAVVARIDGEEMRCRAPVSERACARTLLQTLQNRAQRAYISHHKLHATDAEIEELRAYNRAFEAHDRTQRARKLRELDARLSDVALPPEDRARLQSFRTVLARLARYEADVDSGVEQVEPITEEALRNWVERSKLDQALYRQYGGVVGITPAGLYPHGARAALIVDYLAACACEFADRRLEPRLRAELADSPRMIFRGASPDFTPFWKRAIAPSYMRD
jgi:hypothetical protein